MTPLFDQVNLVDEFALTADYERVEDLPAFQSLKEFFSRPDIEDETRLMVENSHWGKMMLEHEKKSLLGSDDVIMMCDLIKSEGLSCD